MGYLGKTGSRVLKWTTVTIEGGIVPFVKSPASDDAKGMVLGLVWLN